MIVNDDTAQCHTHSDEINKNNCFRKNYSFVNAESTESDVGLVIPRNFEFIFSQWTIHYK